MTYLIRLRDKKHLFVCLSVTGYDVVRRRDASTWKTQRGASNALDRIAKLIGAATVAAMLEIANA